MGRVWAEGVPFWGINGYSTDTRAVKPAFFVL